MSAYGHSHTILREDYSKRDAKLRCMNCGSFAAGSPMCDKCAGEVMKNVESTRRRMQLMFYYILILAAVAYYLIL